jgi:hypothetical protein
MKPNEKSNEAELLPAVRERSGAIERQGQSFSFDVTQLLDKAIDAKSAVEVIKELRQMKIDDQKMYAEQAFNDAMAAFQLECPTITKEKAVSTNAGKVAFRYAPIEVIELQIRPFLQKHGFSHTFDTDTASAEGWVIAKCVVTHKFGHSRTSTGKFPLGTKTNIMSDTQQYAAALTFANRRALANAYALILVGEDMDGMTSRPKPKGPSSLATDDTSLKPLAQELWDVLKPRRGPLPNWDAANQWMWDELVIGDDEKAPSFTAARFREVIEKAKAKLVK